MMPRATGSLSAETSPSRPPKATPAANSAKIGTATPADTGLQRCSKCSAIDTASPSRLSAGTANPSSTPATVAWMPEAWTSAQATTPSGMSNHHDRTRRCTSRVNRPSGTSARSSGTTDSSSV